MNFKNKPLVIIFSILLIPLIGIADYLTGSEITFYVFYLIPVVLIAVTTNKKFVLIVSVIVTATWFLADYYTHIYSNELIPFWNTFVRFSTFIIVGLLVFNLMEKFHKIEKLNEELVALNNEKNRFLGIASHDLRNPISTIYTYSDFLDNEYSGELNSETSEIINYIKELSHSSLNLLGRLLDVSRIEAGIVELSLKSQDYILFIKKCIDLNQILANKKGITIKFESTMNSLTLEYDEMYMREVINNLLTNAVKFSYPDAEIKLRVSLTENENVRTEVIDTGKGIPESEQDKLFTYFHKTSSTPTAGEDSSGLGLAISKKIITEHKGTIGVISQAGKGSNFYFELHRQ